MPHFCTHYTNSWSILIFVRPSSESLPWFIHLMWVHAWGEYLGRIKEFENVVEVLVQWLWEGNMSINVLLIFCKTHLLALIHHTNSKQLSIFNNISLLHIYRFIVILVQDIDNKFIILAISVPFIVPLSTRITSFKSVFHWAS